VYPTDRALPEPAGMLPGVRVPAPLPPPEAWESPGLIGAPPLLDEPA